MPVCTSCNTFFPLRMEVDGKMRRLDHRKECPSCKPIAKQREMRTPLRMEVKPNKPRKCLYHNCTNIIKQGRNRFCSYSCENKFYVTRNRAKKKGLAYTDPEVVAMYLSTA